MTDRVTIRLAAPGDDHPRAALLAPGYRCAPETLITEAAEIRHRFGSFGDLAPGVVAWVAEDEGRIIATAEATVRLHANGCETLRVLFIEGIAVADDHRRGGVARALMTAIEFWAREQGIAEIASDVHADDVMARDWHRALGFTETETVVCLRRPVMERRDQPSSRS